MRDFGQSAIALGRFTDDGGMIGVAGGAAFLFGFAVSPLLGAAIALATANDISNAARQRREQRQNRVDGERELYGLPDLNESDRVLYQALRSAGDASEAQRPAPVNPSSDERFKKVQPESSAKSSAKSSAMGFSVEPVAEADPDWVEEAWTPKIDLSLLPIEEFRKVIPKGTYDPQQVNAPGTRSAATGKVFEYLKSFNNSENVEYLVWFVFGVTKGGNAWYSVASDFCRQCRDHYQRKGTPPDARITW